MKYDLITGVWELTMGCNMRCKHCGSSCDDKQEGELTTEEALKLCDDLKTLEMKSITLSGGEPTIRKDWPIIAKRLSENGILTNMITNGWLFDKAMLAQAVDAKVFGIAISIDGMGATHDRIRRQGSFEKSIEALKLMKISAILPAVITTVNSANIDELDEMHNLFQKIGIDTWQLQLALPMGNLMHNTSFFLEPYHVDQIINFAHNKLDSDIKIVLGDSVGYYNKKALEVFQKCMPEAGYWGGCTAGKNSIGILHNGDITGCTSMRDRQFIEGNIRERSLEDIWLSETSFAWNRNMKKTSLKGLCANCQYSKCLGGCSNLRLCMNGSIYSENKYCSYHIEVTKIEEKVAAMDDYEKLLKNAYALTQKKQFQSAAIVLAKLIFQNPDIIEIKELYGYVHYELENYELCEQINREILISDPENAYASKGLGLALCKLAQVDEGLDHMYRALDMKNGVNAEIYYDLYAVLLSLKRKDAAMQVKEQARVCDNYSDWLERFDSALVSVK